MDGAGVGDTGVGGTGVDIAAVPVTTEGASPSGIINIPYLWRQ